MRLGRKLRGKKPIGVFGTENVFPDDLTDLRVCPDKAKIRTFFA